MDVVEYLLQEGEKRKKGLGRDEQIWAVKDSRGRNIFHHLARRTNRAPGERLGVVKILDIYLEGGAVNMIRDIDNDGYTAIAEAAKQYDKEFCEGLINISRRMLWTFDTISSFSYPLILLDGAVAQVEMAKFETKLHPGAAFSLGGSSIRPPSRRDSLVKAMSGMGEKSKAGNNESEHEASMAKMDDILLRTDNSVLDVILDSSDPRMMRMVSFAPARCVDNCAVCVCATYSESVFLFFSTRHVVCRSIFQYSSTLSEESGSASGGPFTFVIQWCMR